MAEKSLLDLTTLIERPSIDIDGARYELFSADELSVLASHRLSVWGRRIEQIDAGTAEDDGVELERLVDNVVRAAAIDLPAAVFEQLSGAHKRAIVDVFTGLLLRKKLAVVGATARAMGVLPIGATSSPASSDIMADRRGGGWPRRLRRWFGRIWR
jgi:hypothetical protein